MVCEARSNGINGCCCMGKDTVLFTGGTGFLGRSLIDSLAARYRCINAGRHENTACENIPWNLAEAFPDGHFPGGDVGCIVHCASIVGQNDSVPTAEYFDINIKATARLLDFAVRNHARHFIYISSGAVYGEAATELTEDDDCNPVNRYGLSKYISEILCSHCSDKMSVTILRPFFPYGDGQTGRLIPTLINQIANGHEVTLNKDGRPRINPIHISDFVRIVSLVIEKELTGKYNVCGNEVLSLLDICERIREQLNAGEPHYVFRENETLNLIGSNRRICKALNYNLRMRFDEGIAFARAYGERITP